ncbi:uncharacterized protein LOC752969 [Strongylocentrotus purpuratus]|uniref:Uncharacterized protein n=1 Tax=Strongylocentrotus purpuratus TaxID=7668 RepID=A0A7M7LKW6_STRPU|nr:uncharacterized protein LOC752969 [Strongylocentrotus purpuratus]|eukprot:XP_001180755.2 PREDICTED: uncharacterized protein LOC752969 [Strongylocentrotus purpuratus]
MRGAMYRCTLPECDCGEFTAGKTQLKTCDNCKHGWVAHDLITEAQAKKIRKRGTKDGTPCQNGICACGNYQRPPGVAKTSWLAVCDNCKHSETEHRYPTKLDKKKKHNLERAADSACVGCEMQCAGFQQSFDSQTSKKCFTCNHVIDTHRPTDALDAFISEVLDASSNLRCHSSVPPPNKQMSSIGRESNVDDDAFLNAWLEPTNIDHDEDVPFLDPNVCQCRGFCFDDMARICNQYFGFTEGLVAPHIPNLACQSCSHALKYHRHHTDKEQEQLDSRKVSNLTMVGMVSVLATSVPGYPRNVGVSLQNGGTKNSYKLLLAATKLSHRDDPHSNTINISNTTFTIHHGHHHHHHPGRRLSVSSVGDHDESDEEKENEAHQTTTGGKKRGRKMSRLVGDVKKKIKRRRLGSKSAPVSESDTEGLEDEDTDGRLSRCLSRLGSDAMTAYHQRSEVTALSWSHQTKESALAICTDDGTLKIQGSEELVEIKFPEDTGLCTCIAWFHSGKSLITGHACGLSLLWKLSHSPGLTMESSVITQSGNKSRVTSICISGDDRYIALGHQNSEVLIFDTKKGLGTSLSHHGFAPSPQLLSTCSILYGAVLCMAWHPSKLLLVAGGEDDLVTVFHMKKPTSQASRGTLKYFFTRSPRRPTKKGFHQCAVLKGHKSFVGALAFAHSGAYLLSAGWDGQLLVWNVSDIDDAIESEDIDIEIVCSSGFVMGRSSRSQSLNLVSRPFVPQDIVVFASEAVVLYRTSVNRICLAMYEMPKKYSEISIKID